MTSPVRRQALPPIDDDTPSYYRRFISMPPIADRLPAPITPHMVLQNMTPDQLDNNMFQHAVRELVIADYPLPKTLADRPGPDRMMIPLVADTNSGNIDAHFAENVLAMIAMWIQAGHSGGSAPMALSMLDHILSFQALTPLTNHPDEWYQHGGPDEYGTDFWQNKRQGDCFSTDPRLNTYYRLEHRTWFGRSWVYKKLLSRGVRKWLQNSHQFWIYKKFTTKPHPAYPAPGATTASTPILKQPGKHIRPS